MKNKTLLIVVALGAVVVVGLIIAFFSGGQQGGALPQGEDNRPSSSSSRDTIDRLENITLEDYDGNKITLAAFRGTPLVVNSWATWCPFCRQELPDFASLQEELGDTAVVIAIDRAERVSDARGYTDGFGITSKMTFLIDPSDAFYRNIGGFSMPETLFVNAEGVITFHKRGPLTLQEMREAAAQYLK